MQATPVCCSSMESMIGTDTRYIVESLTLSSACHVAQLHAALPFPYLFALRSVPHYSVAHSVSCRQWSQRLPSDKSKASAAQAALVANGATFAIEKC